MKLPGTGMTSQLPGTGMTSQLPGTGMTSQLPGTGMRSQLPGTGMTSQSSRPTADAHFSATQSELCTHSKAMTWPGNFLQ